MGPLKASTTEPGKPSLRLGEGSDSQPPYPGLRRTSGPACHKGLRALMQFGRRARTHAVALAIVTMAGCTVGPDFHAPQTVTPTAWQAFNPAVESGASVTTSQAAALVEWWDAFDDPELSSLVNETLLANLDLRQAKSRIRQARAARGVVASAFWPSVDSSASYRRSYSGGASKGGGAASGRQPTGATDLFQVGLDAVWELDVFGGVRRDIEAAEADIQASVEDYRDVAIRLR
jgi:outer membrane protein, multidrug efflux system